MISVLEPDARDRDGGRDPDPDPDPEGPIIGEENCDAFDSSWRDAVAAACACEVKKAGRLAQRLRRVENELVASACFEHEEGQGRSPE